ncbi:hypothetical protein [Anaerophilus nitritogenes]|uniref:hypothetical protein n=1 Tax=Anaerophilus nitritogenes TaxID=2498136 RepID=UPI00101CABC3|nr:hypothetical protein [Anaerophilus nitritogenes]
MSKLKNVSTGILNGLEEMNSVQEEKSKGVKEEKSKRSFMLTESQIEKIYLLKAKYKEKDLSTFVGEAIEEYYEKHISNK